MEWWLLWLRVIEIRDWRLDFGDWGSEMTPLLVLKIELASLHYLNYNVNVMFKTISTQDLRQNLPKIRQGLAKGVKFILIYRSKPVGQITSLPSDIDSLVSEANFSDMEEAQVVDTEKLGPYASDTEVEYYMSLPPLSHE